MKTLILSRINKFNLLLAGLLMATVSLAQVDILTAGATYYWDINAATPRKTVEVHEGVLGLKYFDYLGRDNSIVLKIYNWKREEVISMVLDKESGLNYYSVELDQYYSGWEENLLYTCTMEDENKKRYEWVMKLVPRAKTEAPVVDILVNPIRLKCDDMEQSNVEFYGKIKGGKAPFLINWYVINNNQTGFLFQPTEEKLEQAGKTTVVLVDSQPDYYVMLHVKDGCGNIEKKMVHLICEKKKKQINTVFIEPMVSVDKLGKPIN